ncbi:hypothetical protein CROQUDRAFT_88268 [Cronartium quercuum f. sp. fusiforme G11]|uniref:Endonuclease/exonuclease/phosphatase domain-containing protein n=1 Tax=Cronartium quercuum f. sp. fusiforme G11 TaxID=708437 RepID=A0A9P6TFZ4_9BASI|nr:hypothetical protein CROQUDRAFT_88268 [Cronartium quercuum f. sp. fusiforme G11]
MVEGYDALLLQEPWVNPINLQIPGHAAWHAIVPFDYYAQDYASRIKTCIYLRHTIPTALIRQLPSRSPLLTAIELLDSEGGIGSTGFGTISTDAKTLIHLCGSAGFKLVSPKGTATFVSLWGQWTAIDLTWVNYPLTTKVVSCRVLLENFGSDHQALATVINPHLKLPITYHNTASLSSLDHFSYTTNVGQALEEFPTTFKTTAEIDTGVHLLSEAINKAFLSQGKTIRMNPTRHKSWWDKDILDPILKSWNLARK